MLTIFRSNRAEALAGILAAQLRESPPPPFEPVEVVVNTWPTSRWLGEQLAQELGGIAAHIRFPFPGSQLRRLVNAVLGEEASGPDPWRATELVWPVLEALPALVEQPAAASLRRWLNRRGGSAQELNLARWQLGRSIADALDDYALYRPDLLQRWWEGADDDSDWQALLVRQLRQRLGQKPFALKVREATARLRGAPWSPPVDGPWRGGCLRLFGLSSMAPVQVELLQAVSAHLAVDLYLLTPCPDLWQQCTNRRARLSDAVAMREPLGSDWITEAGGLEARFGRLGAEFQQLLEGTGACQLGMSTYGDIFQEPTRHRARPDARTGSGPVASCAPAPLLRQLQRQLADPTAAPALERTPGDSSLEFHACPGQLRQVELVRDRILQLLHDDDSLEPRDVLVMTPQVDGFAPLVAAVFGDRDATGVALEWRLTDRSQQEQAGLGRTLLALLRQAGERLTASSLQTLLESGPLRERFALEREAIQSLHRTLQQAGFRWGLDGQERGGEATGSLSWAIDRLLLGVALPEQPGLAPADTAPFGSVPDLEHLGRWLHLLQRLRHWLLQWRRPRSCAAWAASLQTALDDLFGDGGEAGWELPQVLEAIDAWQKAAAGCELELAAPVVAAVLEERLAADAGRFGHRSGALTISALEPMRAIPHRVIVLMGLDAGCFPRQRQRPGFHHLERQRQLGDPSPADQDRYALLEAVLSARDHLLVTWNCRDERNGESLQPATPVSQWMAWLNQQLKGQPGELKVLHPANPLDRHNFMGSKERPPASCDRRLLAARQRLDRPDGRLLPRQLAASQPPQPEAGPPAGTTFEDLRQWAMHPQASWLQGLGLLPREWADVLDDLDAATLDERQRSRLLREALRHEPAADPATDQEQADPGDAEAWLRLQRGRNLLPPAAGGMLEARQLAQRWSDLQSTLEGLGSPRQQPAQWGPWQATVNWQGDTVVVVHTARSRCHHRLDLWLQLLLAAASGQAPRAGVVVARGDRGFGEQLRLRPPEAAAAQSELARLAALRECWRHRCWPLPPETGWALLSRGRSAAIDCWEGSFQLRGEREEPEQALCFGRDLPARQLLDDAAEARAKELLGVLLEHRA